MDYDEEENGAAGCIPEFGAIFMSSIVTKKECFKRKLFALPSSKAEFVKHVKAGMVLFLFEFEKRLLYGVYQASSDGAMDIVRHAFNYSGKRFPAQVCFTPMWHCNPLSEKEFRDAIKENYFSPKKFNFGLSKDQVHRLLYLFSSRKLKNTLRPVQLPEVVDGRDNRDRGQLCHDNIRVSEIGYIDATECDEFKPSVFQDYLTNSLDRDNEDEFMIYDGGNAEEKLYPVGQGGFLFKRRRIDNDDRLVRNDVAENEIYNIEDLRSFPVDFPKDSLDQVRRLDNAHRLSRVERVPNENQMDRYPVLYSDYPMGSLDARANDDDRSMQGNKLFCEFNMGHGSGLPFASECYGTPLDRSKHQGEMFLFDECVQRERLQREQNVFDIIKPTVYGDDTRRHSREAIDDHQHSMNGPLENRYYLDYYSGSQVGSYEHPASLLHKLKNSAVDDNISPINSRIHSEQNFISSSLKGISSENSACLLNYGQRFIDDRRYPPVGGRLTDNTVDSIFFPAAQIRNAGYYDSVDRQLVDDGTNRNSQRVDKKEKIQTITSPITKHQSIPNQKQNSFPFCEQLPEKRPSQLSESHKFEPSSSMLEDATTSRAIPYVPEHPNFSHVYSSSMAANNGKAGLVQENHYQCGSLDNVYSPQITLAPYFSGSKISTGDLDITRECAAEKALPANSLGGQSTFLRKISTSPLNSYPTRQTALDTSAPFNYRGSILPKFSSTSLSSHKERNLEREQGYFSLPSVSIGGHFMLDGDLVMASDMGQCTPRRERGMLISKDMISSGDNDFGVGVSDQVRDLTSIDNKFSGISCNMNQQGNHEIFEAPHCNSNGSRRSVFTRLTSRQEPWVSINCYMNASADEVMEMLQQGNNTRNMKTHKLVGKSKDGESSVEEKQIQSHIDIIHSRKEKIGETHLVIAESDYEVPKETRIVNFKRRSDIKRSVVGASNDSTEENKTSSVNKVVESSTMKSLKRKKLIRPVFGNIETATDDTFSKQNLQLLVLDKDDKLNRKKAINSGESEVPEDKTRLGNLVSSYPNQSLECSNEEHSKTEVQNFAGADVVPSTGHHELEGPKTVALDLQVVGSSKLPDETPQLENFGIQTCV